MFSARRSYSSRTSCSSGERSSLGAEADGDVESADSMIGKGCSQLLFKIAMVTIFGGTRKRGLL